MHQISAQQILATNGEAEAATCPPAQVTPRSVWLLTTALYRLSGRLGRGAHRAWALSVSGDHIQLRCWLCTLPRLQAGGNRELNFSGFDLR